MQSALVRPFQVAARFPEAPASPKGCSDENNNNIPEPPSSQANAPRQRQPRHRPVGESPPGVPDVDSDDEELQSEDCEDTPANAWDSAAAATQQQQQQQQLMAVYYADLVWQSYCASLASMMVPAAPGHGPSLPWGLPTLPDLVAHQQQQQQHLAKWLAQNQRMTGTKETDSKAPPAASKTSAGLQESRPDPKTGGEAKQTNASVRPELQRTRIDMDEFRAELSAMTEVYRACMTAGDSSIERAASSYRSAATSERHRAVARWEGALQVAHPLSVTYSRKVFLGGVPWDSSGHELAAALRDLGRFELVWPQGRERRTHGQQRPGPAGVAGPRGYCYLVFEDERQVKALLQRCSRRDGATYFRLSNVRTADKEVQVIPWCVADAAFTTKGLHSTNAKTTVFVGALHGMITAANLATIMSETFGDVVCAALDTDRYKYPIGSGRVVFSGAESYKNAVEANFLEVKTPKFTKTIQIDPYLEDSMCSVCFYAPGVYFCRATVCFQYYCPPCWQSVHRNGDEERGSHKPLRRTFRNPIDRKFM